MHLAPDVAELTTSLLGLLLLLLNWQLYYVKVSRQQMSLLCVTLNVKIIFSGQCYNKKITQLSTNKAWEKNLSSLECRQFFSVAWRKAACFIFQKTSFSSLTIKSKDLVSFKITNLNISVLISIFLKHLLSLLEKAVILWKWFDLNVWFMVELLGTTRHQFPTVYLDAQS